MCALFDCHASSKLLRMYYGKLIFFVVVFFFSVVPKAHVIVQEQPNGVEDVGWEGGVRTVGISEMNNNNN